MTKHDVTPELLKQVSEQCRVVSHLAKALAEVHDDYAKMMGVVKPMEDIANLVGERSAHLMEELGDMLNGMDAASDDDEWTATIFHEAQRLWPAA